MSLIKQPAEIEVIRQGGKLLAQILDKVLAQAKTGVKTIELDQLAEKLIRQAGGEPSFKNYHSRPNEKPFPSTICASVNNELVHTPASQYQLKAGDILTVDIGMRWPTSNGFYTDMARTIAIGQIPASTQKLLDITRESLARGIAAVKAGKYVSDISKAVQQHVEAAGLAVVRDLVGHGVGYAVHEDPRVPNYYSAKTLDVRLETGMVLAIEPMVNTTDPAIKTKEDGWTVVAADGKLCAHFENTIVVTKQGADILTQA